MIVKHSEEFSKYFLEIENKLSIQQTKHVLDMVSSLITTESKKTVSGLSRTMDCQHFLVQLLFGHICKTVFNWCLISQSSVKSFIIVP